MTNLAGQRFGRLVAIRRVGRKGSDAVWECRCDCGALVHATAPALRSGAARSCGCARPGGRSALAVRRFGRLVSVDPVGEGTGARAVWRCVCDCDRTCYREAAALTSGRATSCGECDP